MTYRFLLPLVCFTLFYSGLIAQKAKIPAKSEPKIPVHLHLKTRHYGDHISLRWGFSEPHAWRYLNKQGYILERFELDNKTNQPIDGVFHPVGPALIKPWSENEWATNLTSADTFAVVAAGCLLGESPMPPDAGMLRQMDLKTKDEANRTTFALFAADMSPMAARGLGLRIEDRDVKPGRKYIYRLRVTDDPSDRFSTDTAMYVVATDKILPLLPPDAPEVQPGDSLLTLRWRKSTEFTAYHVERSEDGGTTWHRLTRKPYINGMSPDKIEDGYIYYPDRVGMNYQKFRYRLIGINPFGDLTEASESTEAEARDLTPTLAPQFTKVQNLQDKVVELIWKMPETTDLKGFVLSKSESVEGPWTPLTDKMFPPDARRFVDSSANEYGRNFYRIYSVDDHGNTAGSNPAFAFMKDGHAPAAPQWLNGTIDTNGVVTLRWRLGKEPDLWGYQIYFSNNSGHAFVPLTGNVLEDTVYSYKIPLNNLTEEIFYTLKAVDINYHVSAESEKLRLTKPDKVAPVSPVFQDFAVRDTGILIVWAPSTSRDVVRHVLLRRVQSQTDWKVLSELPADGSRYFDQDVTQKTVYEYSVYAVDDAGLKSPNSFPLQARAVPRLMREPIENLHCTVDADNNTARVSWKYPARLTGKVRYKVYRVAPNGSLRLITELAGSQPVFEEPGLKKGEAVQYAVRAFHAEGGASPVARTEEIRM